MPPHPTAFRVSPPVHRMLRMLTLAPGPAIRAPQLPPGISGILDESGELLLHRSCPRNSVRRHIDTMSPLFVVEDKSIVRLRSNHVCPTWNGNAAWQRDRCASLRFSQVSGKHRRWIPKSLAGNRECFIVHVFMKEGEQHEVFLLWARARTINEFDNPIPGGLQVIESLVAGG